MKNQTLTTFLFLSLTLLFQGTANANTEKLLEMKNYLSSIQSTIRDTDLYDSSCKENLDSIIDKLGSFEKELLDALTIEEGLLYNSESFSTRLKIKKLVDSYTLEKKINFSCWSDFRRLLFIMRNLEDFNILKKSKTLNKKHDHYSNFKGQDWFFYKNESFKFNGIKDIQSGDMILSLGLAYSSEAIAKIGKQVSNYSHLSMIYKNKAGQLYTIESHGETGVGVYPLKDHLEEKYQTSVLLRYKDPAVAKQAAKLIYKKALKRQKKHKKILYDFSMNYNDSEKLFCSEVIYHAFQLASFNKIDISPYKMTFNKGLIPFLKDFGLSINKENVKTYDVFSPGDILWNPAVQIVSEWKNPAGIESAKVRSVVVNRIFHWISKYNYSFKRTKFIKIAPQIAVLVRKIPYYNFKSRRIRRLLDNYFQKDIQTKQITKFLMVDYISLLLNKELRRLKKQKKRSLSYAEMSNYLDKYREEDLKKYKVYKKKKRRFLKKPKKYKPDFHLHFRPKI